MSNKNDIAQAARLLIELHGQDAEAEAERMAKMTGERGDRQGALLWFRIKRATEFLRAAPTKR